MLSQAVLRRLGEINRRQARSLKPADRQTAEDDRAGASIESWQPPPPATTRDLPAGREVTNGWGSHWRIDQAVDELWPECSRFLKRTVEAVRRASSGECEELHENLQQMAKAFPRKTMFLDLETCGFAGSMIFLVGVLIQRDNRLLLTQLLARHYGEEKAILQTLWEIAQSHEMLVTFNGKSFDWPVVHDRSTLHHLGRDPRHNRGESGEPANVGALLDRDASRPHLDHCDLLHHCRRRWRSKLPNCRLQTLEHYICGRHRSGDIAGRDIPAAYHEFVRTRDAWQMRSVLHHNALDLVTLIQLSLRVLQ